MMPEGLCVNAIVCVPDDRIGETIVDEVFDADEALEYATNHPLASRCDVFIGRDPGDNLFVRREGTYFYWDHETDELHELGEDPAKFVLRIES